MIMYFKYIYLKFLSTFIGPLCYSSLNWAKKFKYFIKLIQRIQILEMRFGTCQCLSPFPFQKAKIIFVWADVNFLICEIFPYLPKMYPRRHS